MVIGDSVNVYRLLWEWGLMMEILWHWNLKNIHMMLPLPYFLFNRIAFFTFLDLQLIYWLTDTNVL